MKSVRLFFPSLLFWGIFFVGKVQSQYVYVAQEERSGNIFVYNAYNGLLLKKLDPCKAFEEDVGHVDNLLFCGNKFFIMTNKYFVRYNLQNDEYHLIERKIPNVDGLKVLTNEKNDGAFIGYDEDKGTIFVWNDVFSSNEEELSYYTYGTGCKRLGVCLSEHDPGIIFYWDKCSNYISIFNFVTGKEVKRIAMESGDELEPVECRVDSVASCPGFSNFVVSYKKITEVMYKHYNAPFDCDEKEEECIYGCCIFDRLNNCFIEPFYTSQVSRSYFSTHVLVHHKKHDVCALRIDSKLMFFNISEGRELSSYKYSDALIKFAFVPSSSISHFFCVEDKVLQDNRNFLRFETCNFNESEVHINRGVVFSSNSLVGGVFGVM